MCLSDHPQVSKRRGGTSELEPHFSKAVDEEHIIAWMAEGSHKRHVIQARAADGRWKV